MLHLEFAPPDTLRDAIKCFWFNRRDGGAAPSRFEVLPDGYVEIVFHFGNGCTVGYGGAVRRLPSPFMVGLLDGPFTVEAEGCLEIIGIRCFPWAVFDLLGLAPARDGVRTLDHPVCALHTPLAASVRAGRVDLALADLERWLLAALPRSAVDPTVAKAGTAMRDADGSLPVSQVATAAHATVRTLQRKFKQSSGHTVKDVSSLIRFESVRNRLWHDPAASLAGLAQELAYADQSHLSKAFKRYSGMSPAAFVQKRMKAN